jgi:hypothetical protein
MTVRTDNNTANEFIHIILVTYHKVRWIIHFLTLSVIISV